MPLGKRSKLIIWLLLALVLYLPIIRLLFFGYQICIFYIYDIKHERPWENIVYNSQSDIIGALGPPSIENVNFDTWVKPQFWGDKLLIAEYDEKNLVKSLSYSVTIRPWKFVFLNRKNETNQEIYSNTLKGDKKYDGFRPVL